MASPSCDLFVATFSVVFVTTVDAKKEIRKGIFTTVPCGVSWHSLNGSMAGKAHGAWTVERGSRRVETGESACACYVMPTSGLRTADKSK